MGVYTELKDQEGRKKGSKEGKEEKRKEKKQNNEIAAASVSRLILALSKVAVALRNPDISEPVRNNIYFYQLCGFLISLQKTACAAHHIHTHIERYRVHHQML
jgi:hypothetical protein